MKKLSVIQPEELSGHIGQTVLLRGAIHKIRRMHSFAFVLLRGRRSVTQCVFSEEFSRFALEDICEECCVELTGEVVAEARSRTGCEVRALDVDVLSRPEEPLPIVINNRELPATLESLLDHRPLTLRRPEQRAIFRVQAAIEGAFRAYCQSEGMTSIHAPRIVSAGAEGGANLFPLDYFGEMAYLAQSPQLYKQMMAGVFERVYEVGPVFRAERHDTSWHLNEYVSMDCEIGYLRSLDELLDIHRGLIAHIAAALPGACGPEMGLLGAEVPVLGALPQIEFGQAKRLLEGELGFVPQDDGDFEREEERLLGLYAREELGSDFLFVTGYPSAKRPFYARDSRADPSATESYDLLFRGMEIATGGLRIHGYAEQAAKMRQRGMDTGAFAPYLQIHRHGMPPHGGFGMGLERMTARLLGLDNVRRATLFPRDRNRLSP